MRQSLHIRIDPSPFDSKLVLSPDSNSPSPQSTPLSNGTSRTTPSSSSPDHDEFSVLCIYDFQAADLDQLSFRKNEILSIVKREETGWWAAMRKGGDIIGWIPQAFVKPLSEEMAERLINVRKELRYYEYSAEQLYLAPISRNDYIFESEPEPLSKHSKVRTSFLPPRTIKLQERDFQDRRQATFWLALAAPWMWLGHKVHSTFRPPLQANFFDLSSRRAWLSDKVRGTRPTEDFSQPVLVLQASVPRYLQPRFADQLDEDADGQIRSGSIRALVERLMATNMENKQYQDIFLMSFRSFMTADALFETLMEYYNLPTPEDLNVSELEDWLERGKRRTQRRVLEIFSDWLLSHHLLEEPHIARRLTEFLQSVTSGPNSKVSKLVQEQIKDLTFAVVSPITVSPSSSTSRRRRVSRPQRGDLLKIEPSDIAEQLTMTLYESYKKIQPYECIVYVASSKGGNATNLREFCAYHDKLIGWVQKTVLTADFMRKRAEIIDYWIKVAEKCRALHNIFALSALITALTSTVVTRLPLTWAHVKGKSTLDSLARFNEPAGGFATYRNLNNAEGPCLPFISMYLVDLAHIQDQYIDKEGMVSFYKRKRFYEVTSTMLRHQKEPYTFASDDVATFIRKELQETLPDSRWFWKKNEEVQQSELAHADIRKGLEKVGF
ncbi:hypothetical protein AGABI2DRAFT_214033 [Agaricus bisporus var. bisporus H97]|uniref:hypothetical protein n=1 Tax=Agaricus bisporus var. bisporus (strain H97 / ATCC MYA-4626 / FGSC 10389) TaxID=936046 RepID=UPI00029F6631|nr:hypothetical protein AGABI2DRAFT_214033 [Agaricus bisporus var. bisporus H97]EKV51251.1 hypothetical protein AGABI2DRAFT_214033 [Agaricus bisporus var. bisporus H97]